MSENNIMEIKDEHRVYFETKIKDETFTTMSSFGHVKKDLRKELIEIAKQDHLRLIMDQINYIGKPTEIGMNISIKDGKSRRVYNEIDFIDDYDIEYFNGMQLSLEEFKTKYVEILDSALDQFITGLEHFKWI